MELIKSGVKRAPKEKGRSRKVKTGVDRSQLRVAKSGEAMGLDLAVDVASEKLRLQPLLVWMSDGSCFEGTTEKLADEFMFIGARVLAPVGSIVSIRPTELGASLASSWDGAEATVVWHCPAADHFRSRMGFGVRLHGSSPLKGSPGVSSAPKEAAGGHL